MKEEKRKPSISEKLPELLLLSGSWWPGASVKSCGKGWWVPVVKGGWQLANEQKTSFKADMCLLQGGQPSRGKRGGVGM